MKSPLMTVAKGRPTMSLTFGSGKVRRDPTEEDIRGNLAGQTFAILALDPETYIQCSSEAQPYGQYLLEYQQGSTNEHFRATDPRITSDRVVKAFCKYLEGDESWRLDFRWEPLAV